jgi:DNA sulfur modification protein DndB
MVRTERHESLAPLVSTDGERHAEFKRRRDQFVYMKVPSGAEAPYVAEGWAVAKKLKRQIRLSRDKEIDRQFEDQVWRLFYRMGYDDLNKGDSFTIKYKAANGTFRSKQIDLFAKDKETIVIGECKCCDDYKPRSLSKDIAEFVGLRKQLADAIRSHYGRDFKPKVMWFLFTDKVLWSQADVNKAKAENLFVMTEREIEYFSQLSEHLGRATRYQFLAEYLGGQRIPELRDVKIPAIRGKLGGKNVLLFRIYSGAAPQDMLCKSSHASRPVSAPHLPATCQEKSPKGHRRVHKIGRVFSN